MSETRTPYSYSVLRYVHDIGTGEFINVGVVVLAPGVSFLGAKFKTAYGRLKRTFPTINPDAYRARMRMLQGRFDEIAQRHFGSRVSAQALEHSLTIENVVHRVLRPDDSSLQWAPAGSGISRDLPATLVGLYERFVTKYDSDAAAVPRKDDDVWRHFRTELEKRNVLRHLGQKVISVQDDSIKFDHAWKNGTWHCYEPLSFDLSSDASIKEKAHRWLGQVSSIKDAAEPFSVFFLVGKPEDAGLHEAYSQAVSILRKTPRSQVVEEDAAAAFSESVAEAIAKEGPLW